MPTELVVQDSNGQPITDSLTVAAKFGKRHDNVVQSIKTLLGSGSVQKKIKEGLLKIQEANYIDRQGKSRTMYELDRDGFTILAMGFTGEKAHKFKKAYIAAFNAMEKKLFAPAQPATELEILLGAVNGLVAQDKRLKDLETKTVQADERNKAIEEKVNEIDHVFKTNGCAKGFMPLKDARMTYGNGLSRRFLGYKRRIYRNTLKVGYGISSRGSFKGTSIR